MLFQVDVKISGVIKMSNFEGVFDPFLTLLLFHARVGSVCG